VKRVADSFVGGFCLGLGLSLNIYNVCTYLLPGELVHYESAYELNIPGAPMEGLAVVRRIWDSRI
jgi:hypothetical protein